jgi:uncharacterized integral membrane protein (TIGR00698 family)
LGPVTTRELARLLPGGALVAGLTLAAYVAASLTTSVSSLIWALLLGAVFVNVVGRRPPLDPGITFAARRVLRIGVALLGLRMSIHLLATIGFRGLAVVVCSLTITLLATVWLGRRLGLPPPLALLIATGSAICGASAIAAMEPVAGASEDEVAFAVGTVTLFGTVALLILPVLGSRALGLGDDPYGVWAGASVHEVAQVVAATAGVSAVALKVGTIVKLARVTMLAPVVAIVASRRGRHIDTGRLPVPVFVLAFLGFVVLRSTGWLPGGLVHQATRLDVVLLTAALAGLGLGVDVRRLRHLGWRPIALGFASWILIASVSLALVTALY